MVPEQATPLLFFAASVLFYHVSEVVLVVVLEPEELSVSSLLLSAPYLVAMSLGLFEYHLAWRLLPALKQPLCRLFFVPGLLLAVAGDTLRKVAWLTARRAFTHRIQAARRPGHLLVTHGVYRFARHPAYLGWLFWAVGTQVLLGNVVAAVAFAAVAWRFFARRIPVEEFHLFQMFGSAYQRYRKRTPTLIPGIP